MTFDMGRDSVRVRFQRWFDSLAVSQAHVAERLHCDQSALSRLLSGERGASLALAAAIEVETADWTEGPIRAVDWADKDVTAA